MGYLATFFVWMLPTWVPKHHLSPLWCSGVVNHPVCVDATCKKLCCQKKEAPAAALKTFKSKNKERDLESSCSEICVCQSQAVALWRSLIKDGSFPIWSSNPKYILSPHRLEAKLWLLTRAPQSRWPHPWSGRYMPYLCQQSGYPLAQNSCQNTNWAAQDTSWRLCIWFPVWVLENEQRKAKQKSQRAKRDRVSQWNSQFSIVLMGYRRKWHFCSPAGALW